MTCARSGNIDTGNDILILHEIKHALARLLETGETTTIDLRSIPMAPGEEAKIEAMLGEGEISVKLNALGPSSLIETNIKGVWLIVHYNNEDEVLGKFIEITYVPSLITSPQEDVENSLAELNEKLEASV